MAHPSTGALDIGDASQVDPLLAQIAVPIGQFTADGAYDGKPTFDAVTGHSVGAMVVIPPRAKRWKGRTPNPPVNETAYRGDQPQTAG